MIFEVPVDHFPPQHDRVQRAASLLPILFKMQSRNEISANVEVLTPSVRHSQFAFPLPSQRTFPDTQIPREDSLTSLKKAVHSATSNAANIITG
ncbi:hypothetical protein KIN20_005820 [Parelaphostrongylus tenuis]|uniref:Uncharacterized protein n=1 Tax=Parelaphostrongylus tenuis TaxID=148309 RepID=A0AAD5M539_PARTN|nr:hypothetical protein KIN20_005820 [Parelaphostrongylus tenuis]